MRGWVPDGIWPLCLWSFGSIGTEFLIKITIKETLKDTYRTS
nr:MAG TPA: hypothetical protein [Caudoviricetes sp.]